MLGIFTGKQYRAVLMAGLMCLFLTACSDRNDEGTSLSSGRFVEEVQLLPSGAEYILDMQIVDEKIVMLTRDGIFESDDYGAVWREAADKPEFFSGGRQNLQGSDTYWYVYDAAVDKAGNMVFLLHWYADIEDLDDFYWQRELFDYQTECIYVDTEGKMQVLPIKIQDPEDPQTELELTGIALAENGDLLALVDQSTVYQIDISAGQIMHTYVLEDNEMVIQQYMCIGDILLFLCGDGFRLYDLNSGKVIESGSLDEFYAACAAGGSTGDLLLAKSHKNDRMYLVNRDGVYSYKTGSSQVEMLINGTYFMFANVEYNFSNAWVLNDEHIVIDGRSNSGPQMLFHYYYDETAEIVPRKELMIYALTESDYLRQIVSKFQAEHKEYYIKLEIGYSQNTAFTAAEAIADLNARFEAGDAPDIIITDGLPVSDYAEKGYLMELSELMDSICEEQDLFENIVYVNETAEGLYNVPVRFEIPAISGEAELIAAVSDVTDLLDDPEKLKTEKEGSVIGSSFASEIIYNTFLLKSHLLFANNAGMAEEAVVREMLECAEAFYKYGLSEDVADTEPVYFSSFTGLPENSSFAAYAAAGMQSAAISAINNMEDYFQMLALQEEMGWSYLIPEEGRLFLPVLSVGITNTEDKIEESSEFLHYVFSEELQSQWGVYDRFGFPVHTASFELLYEEQRNNNNSSILAVYNEKSGELISSYHLRHRYPTEREFTEMTDAVQQLSIVPLSDNIIRDIVVEEGIRYLQGRQSIDEAAEKIVQAVNLYKSG